MTGCPRAAQRVAATGLLILLTVRTGYADGWRIPTQGVKALGTSYAGRCVITDDGTVVWFNPAAMTKLTKKWTITFAPPLITYQLGYTDLGTKSLIGQSILGPKTADGGRTAPVPYVYIVRQINDRVAAGFGFNAPFGLGTDYGETYAGRYFATQTSLTVFNLNPTLAVKARPNLSVGFGLDVQRSQATLASMIDFGSIGAASGLGLTPQGQDGKIAFTGHAWAVGADLSLLWDASDKTRVGITYRSKTTHTLKGTANFTVPAAATALTAGGALFKDGGATTTLPMPTDIAMSASQAVNAKWTLLGDVSWSGWSAFKTLGVTFDNPLQPAISQNEAWRNTLRGAVGGEYHANDRWTWRAGGAYEMVPVPDTTRGPRLPEENHVWMSVGGTHRLSPTMTIDFSYAHLRTKDAPMSLVDPNAGTLLGQVHWRLNVFAVAWNKSF
jgi:long-chain fatty acid transport protein